MSWLNNMKTGKKVLLLAGILCAAIVAGGAVGVYSTSKIATVTKTLYEKHMMGLSEIKEADVNILCLARSYRNTLVIDADKAARERRLEEGEGFYKAMMEHINAADKTIVTDEVKAKMAEVKDLTGPYMDAVRRTYRLAIDDKIDEAKAEMLKFAPTANALTKAFAELAKSKETIGKKCFEDAEATYANIRNTLIAMTVAAMVAGLGFGWFIARMIGKVLGVLIGEANRLTEAAVGGKLQTRGNPSW